MRSGDIVLAPLIFFGAGISRGEFLRAVSPADLAPTPAFLCGVTLPRPDGEVLTEAIASGGAPVARPVPGQVPAGKQATPSERRRADSQAVPAAHA